VPGWQVIYNRIRIEMVTGQSRQTSWPSLAEAAFLHGSASAQRLERMWIVMLEDATAGHREVATFLLVGGDYGRASVPM
jgi:hypothetical protein